MILLDDIRINLQNAIKESPHKKKDICAYLGIRQSTLSQYLSGRAMPALDTFAKLCVFLDLDSNEILGIANENKSK